MDRVERLTAEVEAMKLITVLLFHSATPALRAQMRKSAESLIELHSGRLEYKPLTDEQIALFREVVHEVIRPRDQADPPPPARRRRS
jgi:hypothetical protein